MIGGINYKVTKLYKVEWVGLEIWAFLSVAQHYTQLYTISNSIKTDISAYNLIQSVV